MSLQICLFCTTTNHMVWQEVVKWLSKVFERQGEIVLAYCHTLLCAKIACLLQCVCALAAAFLGVSSLSEHHSNWCFWYSLSHHFLSYCCCCTVSMKQWHCLDLQSPYQEKSIAVLKTELMVQRLPSTARCMFAAESWRESKKTRQMGSSADWCLCS